MKTAPETVPEIAVACDVRLGAYAKEFPGFEVTINPNAIASVLSEFREADSKLESLLFVTVHPSQLAKKSDSQSSATTFGSFARPTRKRPATIRAAVRPIALTRDENEKLVATLEQAGFAHSTIAAILPDMPEALYRSYNAENLQDTAVHELKHASEYGVKQLRKLDRNQTLRFNAGSMIATLSVTAVGLVATTEVIDRQLIDPIAANLGYVAVIALTQLQSRRYDKRRGHEAYLQRPSEIRARSAASQLASTFEPIITVKQ